MITGEVLEKETQLFNSFKKEIEESLKFNKPSLRGFIEFFKNKDSEVSVYYEGPVLVLRLPIFYGKSFF